MKKNERVLFGFTLAPVLLCGGFLLWYVRHNLGFENFAIASALLISLIVTAFLSIRKIRNSFLEPMARLTQQLDEPALSLNPSSFESNTPFHHLASSLQALINHNDESLRDQLSQLSHKNQELQVNKQSQIEGALLERQLERQKHQHQMHIFKLSQQNLAEFIVLNNLQRREPTDAIRHDLNFSARQIVFLLRELQTPSFSQPTQYFCNIYQETDEAIRLTLPLLKSRGFNIVPIFERSCPEKISASVDSFKSVIFNFLLNSEPQKSSASSASNAGNANGAIKEQILTLHLRSPSANTLHISLSDTTNIQSFSLQQERSQQNRNGFNMMNIDNTLIITIKALERSSQHILKLKARVVADKPEQRLGIENRLRNLGFEIVDNDEEIDLCFIICKKDEDILSATKGMDTNTLVLLSENETYFDRQGWYQLASPILQQELQDVVEQYYFNLRKVFDSKLALHRANNQSDLMEEMLGILMNSLTQDRLKILDAKASKNITILQEVVHKVEGGLLYTGASELEETIQLISKVIRHVDTFDEEKINPLMVKLEQNIADLQSWYLGRHSETHVS